MPRIRSIPPEVCDLPALADVSAYAIRTWFFLWTHLDDKGRGVDSPKLWAGKLYSLNDKMTEDRVEKDFSELEEKGLLVRYEVDGSRYVACAPVYWKWQKPQHPTPSTIPEPPSHEDLMRLSGASHSGEERSRSGDEMELEPARLLARALRAMAIEDKVAANVMNDAEDLARKLAEEERVSVLTSMRDRKLNGAGVGSGR